MADPKGWANHESYSTIGAMRSLVEAGESLSNAHLTQLWTAAAMSGVQDDYAHLAPGHYLAQLLPMTVRTPTMNGITEIVIPADDPAVNRVIEACQGTAPQAPLTAPVAAVATVAETTAEASAVATAADAGTATLDNAAITAAIDKFIRSCHVFDLVELEFVQPGTPYRGLTVLEVILGLDGDVDTPGQIYFLEESPEIHGDLAFLWPDDHVFSVAQGQVLHDREQVRGMWTIRLVRLLTIDRRSMGRSSDYPNAPPGAAHVLECVYGGG
jgi:hypothetical protein